MTNGYESCYYEFVSPVTTVRDFGKCCKDQKDSYVCQVAEKVCKDDCDGNPDCLYYKQYGLDTLCDEICDEAPWICGRMEAWVIAVIVVAVVVALLIYFLWYKKRKDQFSTAGGISTP
jgi:hypothetical protein